MNKSDPFGAVSPSSELTQDEASDAPAADEPVQVEHIGALLCATRMRLGGDLQEIAKTLRIRYGYLVAIEDGRHEDLPGAAYSVGFVRAYADYLGLDGDEVVRRLREESAGTAKRTRYEFPAPSGESGLPNAGLLAIAISLGMVVYGGWYTMSASDRDTVDLIQEVPDRLAILLGGENSETPSVESTESVSSSSVEPLPQNEEDGQEQQDPPVEVALADTSVAPTSQEDELEVASSNVQNQAMGLLEAEGDAERSPVDTSSIAPSVVSEPDTPANELAGEQPLAASTMQAAVASQPARSDEEADIASVPDVDAEVEASAVALVESSEGDAAESVISVFDAPISEDDEMTTTATMTERGEGGGDEPSVQVPDIEVATETQDNVETSSEVADTARTEDDASQGLSQGIVAATESESATETEEDIVAAVSESSEQVAAVGQAADDGTLTIALRAKSDSWIQVRDGNDLLLTRLLRQGEVYTVPDRSGLTLMTGNAGGLEVFVDGELMPPLGDEGVVRRGVPLSAEQLRAGVEPG